MAKSENIKILKEIVNETLKKMTFENFTIGERIDFGSEGENTVFNIASGESDLLIGQYGANLRALQHILRAMARKKIDERMHFSVDVNDYSRQKIGSLEEVAKSMARQAIEAKRPMVLRPMSAYERRIVHMTLAENTEVKTESIGEDEDRKVVIKPIGSIESGNGF